ncbi:hypothetical protein [uncultured Maribacter sp.]|uniref:hypothetical protein n=1 Tax=uncultured Maribacter sp. TaxID=431308 RepID=UPI00260F8699|nr:hypothetical protein [uncultured Maribacter sp.]
MRPRSLKIFKKRKGVYISPENLVAIFWTGLVFLMAYLKQSYEYDFNGWETTLLILWLVYVIGLMISTFFRYEREIGTYCGKLTFWGDRIQVNDENYNLSQISKLDFNQAYDIRGMFVNSMLEFTPHLSNGLNNLMILELKNGEKIKRNFLQTESERLSHFKEVLIHYHKNGILGWLSLINILEIEDYDKIQDFKKEITMANKN